MKNTTILTIVLLVSMFSTDAVAQPTARQWVLNFDPDSVDSGIPQEDSGGQRDRRERRNGRRSQIVIQSIGAAAIIYCNQTQKCGGFNASLSTIPGSTSPEYGSYPPPVYGGRNDDIPSGSTGPVFPFSPSTTTGSSIPSGWSSIRRGQLTIIAPFGDFTNGELRNGVIFGRASGQTSTSVAASLTRGSTYLKSKGMREKIHLGNRMCDLFLFEGFSPKLKLNEEVGVYICSKANGLFTYALAVGSGNNAARYRNEIRGLIYSELSRL
ncbi:MAG: hypothetical protein KF881_01560 [Acidobacteria bacterium]|nr:hypothetical protein [Acidobacteriota bacterium]